MSGYSFLRGVFVALSLCTLAVAGLTFIQHGLTADVAFALGAAAILYLVTEWYMPRSEGSGQPKDLVDPDHADQHHEEERKSGHPDRPQPQQRHAMPGSKFDPQR